MQVIGMVMVSLGWRSAASWGSRWYPCCRLDQAAVIAQPKASTALPPWRCTRPVAGYRTLRGDRRWLPTHGGHRDRESSCPWEEARAGIHRSSTDADG